MKNKPIFNGIVELEGSKSILNRVLILSTFLNKPLKVGNFSHSEDINTMVHNLKILGMEIRQEQNTAFIHTPQEFSSNCSYYIKDSGTALRFLLARLAFIPGQISELDVSEQLRKRPIGPLIEVLRKTGVEFIREDYPLKLKGSSFSGGKIEIPASESSQFVSSLLLCTPALDSDLNLYFTGQPVSASYIDLTIHTLLKFGINVERSDDHLFIKKGQKVISPDFLEIEPDMSSAACFLTLGALTKGMIKLNLPADSMQPDRQFTALLEKMGASIVIENDLIYVKESSLSGIRIDMRSMPDQVPNLAVLALFADSPTVISGIEHLRFKESDRLQGLLQELPKLGAEIFYSNKELIIKPLQKEPVRCILNTHEDHRLVMSFYILTLIFPQIRINDGETVKKSFPGFFAALAKLSDNS